MHHSIKKESLVAAMEQGLRFGEDDGAVGRGGVVYREKRAVVYREKRHDGAMTGYKYVRLPMAPNSAFDPTFAGKAEFLLRYPKRLHHITIRKQNSETRETKRPWIDFPGSTVPMMGTTMSSVYWGFGLCVGNGVGNEGVPEAEKDVPPPLIKLAGAALPAAAECIAIGGCDRPASRAQKIINR